MKAIIVVALALISSLSCISINSELKSFPGDNVEEITENTVGELNGVRVGVSNILEDTYFLPYNRQLTGMTAQLFVFTDNTDVTVGKGSVITINKSQWEVVKVEKEGNELGCVTFQRVINKE